ncbi:MAG: pteridine-dependent deoxygenase like protein [Oceanococcaceae bacterium]
MPPELLITPADTAPGVGWSRLLRFGFHATDHGAGAASVTLDMATPKPLDCESWWVPEPVIDGCSGGVHHVTGRDWLMARVAVPLDKDIANTTEQAYDTLLAWLRQHSAFALYRIWNYFPQMTAGDGDDERYRRFSVGRMRAFARHDLGARQRYPAATAIGTADGPLHIIALAGRRPCEYRENPRQTSAWEYPRDYGPQSPSFARACAVATTTSHLLVSGTASVVGHRTAHPGDWSRQLDETLRNLAAISAGHRAVALRLYAHPSVPMAEAAARLATAYPEAHILPLEGEICRRDLRVEVEGVWCKQADIPIQ